MNTEQEIAISPAEFAEQMRAIEKMKGDSEMMHIAADDLLCNVLESLGYSEGVKVFDSLNKWYA